MKKPAYSGMKPDESGRFRGERQTPVGTQKACKPFE
jgi:hypothetical protein